MALTLKVHKSPKSIWLLVLMLLSVNLWYFAPLSMVMASFGVIFYLIWLCLGHFFFKPQSRWMRVTLSRRSTPVRLIYLGVLLSFIPAFVYYGQSPVTSFLTTRSMWSLLTLPLLLVVKPDERDVRTAVNWFILVLVAVTFMDSILNVPVLDRTYLMPAEAKKNYIDNGEYVHILEGYWWVAAALAFKLDDLKRRFDLLTVGKCVVLLLILFIFQNRTMMVAALAITALTFVSLKGRNRTNTIVFRSCAVVILLVIVVLMGGMATELIEETISELGNSNYNRALSLVYFFAEAPDSLLKIVFGCGFISANVSTVMQDLMQEGIYNSDVGLVGFWNYFGLLPVGVILYTQLKALFARGTGHYVRCIALTMLMASITICCYTDPSKVLWLCVFFYLWTYRSS